MVAVGKISEIYIIIEHCVVGCPETLDMVKEITDANIAGRVAHQRVFVTGVPRDLVSDHGHAVHHIFGCPRCWM